MVIVVPMAGEGRRFQEAGFTEPKPFFDVAGEPMIDRVVRNLRWIARYASKQRLVLIGRHPIDRVRHLLAEGDVYVQLDKATQGAVDTILQAQRYIDPDEGLLIGNCDQLLFTTPTCAIHADGMVATFPSDNPAYSYVQVDSEHLITKIVEKDVISQQAVVGVFYLRRGRCFIEAAKQVVEHDTRYNGEFYVSSVIDRMVASGYRIEAFHTRESCAAADVHMLGAPDSVRHFEEGVRNGSIRLP